MPIPAVICIWPLQSCWLAQYQVLLVPKRYTIPADVKVYLAGDSIMRIT